MLNQQKNNAVCSLPSRQLNNITAKMLFTVFQALLIVQWKCEKWGRFGKSRFTQSSPVPGHPICCTACRHAEGQRLKQPQEIRQNQPNLFEFFVVFFVPGRGEERNPGNNKWKCWSIFFVLSLLITFIILFSKGSVRDLKFRDETFIINSETVRLQAETYRRQNTLASDSQFKLNLDFD